MLERIAVFIEGRPVPVQHSGDAIYVKDESGAEWVCKKETNTGWEALLAEAIGWMLGSHLGVPQPDAGWDRSDSDGLRWLSRRIEGVMHWGAKPDDANILNVGDLGAAIALDAILWNLDRHQGNILLQPQVSGAFRAFAIDMDHAEVGWVDDFAGHGIDAPDMARNHARNLPLTEMTPTAITAGALAAGLDRLSIESLCTAACNLVQEDRVVTLSEALYRRCQAAPAIIHQYLGKLGG